MPWSSKSMRSLSGRTKTRVKGAAMPGPTSKAPVTRTVLAASQAALPPRAWWFFCRAREVGGEGRAGGQQGGRGEAQGEGPEGEGGELFHGLFLDWGCAGRRRRSGGGGLEGRTLQERRAIPMFQPSARLPPETSRGPPMMDFRWQDVRLFYAARGAGRAARAGHRDQLDPGAAAALPGDPVALLPRLHLRPGAGGALRVAPRLVRRGAAGGPREGAGRARERQEGGVAGQRAARTATARRSSPKSSTWRSRREADPGYLPATCACGCFSTAPRNAAPRPASRLAAAAADYRGLVLEAEATNRAHRRRAPGSRSTCGGRTSRPATRDGRLPARPDRLR